MRHARNVPFLTAPNNSDPHGIAYKEDAHGRGHLYVGDRAGNAIYQYSIGGHYENSIRAPRPAHSSEQLPSLRIEALTRMVDWIAVAWSSRWLQTSSNRWVDTTWVQWYNTDEKGWISDQGVVTNDIVGIFAASQNSPRPDAVCGEIQVGNTWYMAIVRQHTATGARIVLYQFDAASAQAPRFLSNEASASIVNINAEHIVGMAKTGPPSGSHLRRLLYIASQGTSQELGMAAPVANSFNNAQIDGSEGADLDLATYPMDRREHTVGLAGDRNDNYWTVTSDDRRIHSFSFSPPDD